jgi:hypothetical protein
MLYPVLDLVLTRDGDFAAIRHDFLGEASWHNFLLPVRLARSFPRQAIGIDLVYFLLRATRQPLLVRFHARRGTKPHAPVKVCRTSQLSAAVIAT